MTNKKFTCIGPVLFCFLALSMLSLELAAQVRTWVDTTGNHKVEAEFKAIDGNNVVLLKPNGKEIRVPRDRLSTEDMEFLASLANDNAKSERRFRAREAKIIRAELIEDYYENLLASGTLPSNQTEFIRRRMEVLATPIRNKSLLIRGKFVTPEEYVKMRTESNLLVEEWDRLLKESSSVEARSFKQAKKAIQLARRVDTVSFRADFSLGLANIFVRNDFAQAQKHFEACIRRAEMYAPLLEPVDRHNLANALNNLALLKVRENKLQEARLHWREMLSIMPKMTPETAHNIQRVVRVIEVSKQDIDKSYIRSTDKTIREYQDWHQELLVAKQVVTDIDSSVGWLYLPFVIGPAISTKTPKTGNSDTQSSKPAKSTPSQFGGRFVTIASGSSFIVSPGYLLTNRHVVESNGVLMDRVLVHVASGKPPLVGKVLAVSDEHDLALIACLEIQSEGIPLRNEDARLAEQVIVAGYPLTEILGAQLTVTKGVVSQLPNEKHGEFVMDAAANSGNSGGPIIDENGNVVGILNAGYVHKDFQNRLTMGVGSSAAIEFLKMHIPSYTSVDKTEAMATDKIVKDLGAGICRLSVQISESRLRALSVSTPPKSNASRNANQTVGTSLYRKLEDKACLICDGFANVECLNSACKRGRVAQYRIEERPGPIEGVTIRARVKYYVTCPTCSGSERSDCWGCIDGRQGF